MSTSLLYHGFGIRGYSHIKTTFRGGEVVFWVKQEAQRLRCAKCGSWDVIRRGQTLRGFRSVPIGSRRVKVMLPVQRVECRVCGVVRQVKVDFAKMRRSYTRPFERYVLELSKRMTIRDVARHLGVSWGMVKDIQERYLKKRFARPKLKKVCQIAIDEICIGRGHHYLTVVLDLLSGAVIFVGDGKGAKSLDPFWKRLKRSRAKVKAVAMDMSPAYMHAVMTSFPEATIVFDHFHIIKLFNDKLTKLRRDLYREATDKLGKKVLKGTRWLLLKNPGNLDDKRNEAQRLNRALRLNEPLAAAYYMKEDLRLLWDQPDKQTAQQFLSDWIARATSSAIRMLKDFAKTLGAYRSGILAYYDYPISTGPLEGTNTKIRVLQRQAYGFRNTEFFKLKIMALHETKYALVG